LKFIGVGFFRATGVHPRISREASPMIGEIAKSIVPRRAKVALRAYYEVSRPDHEPELDLLKHLCARGANAVDVGGMLGVYSYFLSRLAAHVYTFEPHPELFEKLRESFGRNVTVLPYALSDAAGVAELALPQAGAGEVIGRSTIEPGANLEFDRRLVRVPKRRLDQLGIADIGFIKINVEGHELAVLEGARQSIASFRPTIQVGLQERLRPGIHADATGLLAGLGYDGFFVWRRALLPGNEFRREIHQRDENVTAVGAARNEDYAYNFIFVHRSRPEIAGRLKQRLQH
jgi:FkbM family methyltransferase